MNIEAVSVLINSDTGPAILFMHRRHYCVLFDCIYLRTFLRLKSEFKATIMDILSKSFQKSLAVMVQRKTTNNGVDTGHAELQQS